MKVFAKLPNPTPSFTTIADLGGGFLLKGACPASGAELELVFTQSIGVDLKAGIVGALDSTLQRNATAGPTTLSLSTGILGETSFTAATTSGTVVSGTLGFDTPGSFDGEDVCAFYGHVIES